jgi:Uma2 family endonuclease
MALLEKTRVTVAEFNQIAEMPENRERNLELIAGEIVEKIMPKPLHGFVFHLVYMLIGKFLELNPIGYLLAEVQFEVPGEDYAPIPDIAFVSVQQPAFSLDKAIPFMPALAIEIQSPDQSDREMTDKAGYYLKHGAQMVWLLYPDRKLVEVLTPTERRLLTADQTLDGGDVLPGFSAEVAKLFLA